MLPVGRAEALLVVVRALVQRAREEAPIRALLELHGVHTRVLRRPEEPLRPLDAALVVVADLGNHEARGVVRNPPAADGELAQRPILASGPGGFSRPLSSGPGDAGIGCRPWPRRSLSSCPSTTSSRPFERAIDDALTAELPVDEAAARDRRRRLDRRDARAPARVRVARERDARLPRPEPRQGRGAPRPGLQHATGRWSAILDADLE